MLKKSILVTSLVLSLVACEKENTKVTVTGKDGKIIELSQEKIAELIKKPNAIIDSSGFFKAKFLLEKGAKFPFVSLQKDTKTMITPDGKKQSMSEETKDEMLFEVTDVQKEVYSLNVNLISKKLSSFGNGQKIVVDTKALAPKEQNLKMLYLVNKSMMNSTLNVQMNPIGKILSVKGFEPIYGKIETALKTSVKDASALKNIMQGVKASFNSEVMTKQLEKSINVLPKKGVKLGGIWTETENLDQAGKIKNTTNYTLKNVNEAEVEIEISGGIPQNTDKQSKDNFTRTFSIKSTQNGKILIDRKTGWVTGSVLNINSNQKESISDGKKTESMTSNTVSSMKIN